MSEERLLIETLLRIPDKEGRDVDFILNTDQRAFDAASTGRDIIAKYRQGGFSTFPLGRSLVRCLAHRNRRCVIIAHNTDTTQKLLQRVHYMLKHFKGPAPSIKYATQNRLFFDRMDSSIFIGTAGSDDYGVGDTITDLHCSEVSRWPNPEALLSGLFQAVPPTGNILLESTGHGVGNWFHSAVMRAASGGGAYRLHFFNWLNTPEYALPVPDDFAISEDLEEPYYVSYGVTPAQLMWRRMKLEELNYDFRLFRENYPVTLDECFQGTGYGVFKEVRFEETSEWHNRDPWTSVLGSHPMIGRGYVVGVDPAGGVGKDFSVAEIFDAETGEQVLEYRNNMIEPDRFALKVFELGRQFNDAYISPERNNHGIVFVKELLNLGYPQARLHQPKRRFSARQVDSEVTQLSDFGMLTTEVTKALMIDELVRQARAEMLIHSKVLRLEMASFVEGETGRLEAEKGCFDDCVMATALAAYVRVKAARMFHNERVEAKRSRNLSVAELFEAGRALAELEARYEDRDDGPLPISSFLRRE